MISLSKLILTKKQEELLQLLKDGVTLTESKLPTKQTYKRIINLKNKGYNIIRQDFANNGITQFKLATDLVSESDTKILYTLPNTDSLRTIVLSDLHLGNSLQRIDILNDLYDYCINNNIHIILNCGDFLEGIDKTSVGKVLTKDYQEQLLTALNDFPYDKNIINLLVLGNHDSSFIEKENLNLLFSIPNLRHDIVPIAYKKANINIKNDNIVLLHPNDNYKQRFNDKIIFRGHSHLSRQILDSNRNNIYIYVPTCSDIFHNNGYELPSILDVTFNFANNGLIKEVDILTLVYINKFIKVSSTKKSLNANKMINKIKYEEEPNIKKL